jgi:hypothetical protein
LRKFLPIPTNSRVFPTLSCINLRVWGLILKSLIHFELRSLIHIDLVQTERLGPFFSLLHVDIEFFSTICSRDCHFASVHCGFFVKKSNGYNYLDLLLGCLFHSIGHHVCFCAMAFLFLWFCSIAWIHVVL